MFHTRDCSTGCILKRWEDEKMKVVSLLGSPRGRANSTILAARFCDAAGERGAQVRTFVLNDLQYRGCQACMACKGKQETCILEDDLTEVLQAVADADVLVMASPVYYGEVSSQLKGFIDRTFSYLVPDFPSNPRPSRLEPGKKLVFILSQGQPNEKQFADIFPRYSGFFKWHGFGDAWLIRACGVMAEGDVEKRQDLLDLARKTALEVCEGA